MTVPTNLSDCSTTLASNSPAGSDPVGPDLDNFLRAHSCILAKISAGSNALVTPALGTPASGTLTNCTGLPASGVVGTALVAAAIGTTVQAYDADLTTWAGITPGTGIATALAINVGSAGAPVVLNGALGTPSSGVVSNCTSTSMVLTTPVLGTPTSGNLSNCTVDGTTTVGFRGIPQGTSTTTLVLADAGKTQYYTGTATVTIPTNASVAFPIGTAITFVIDHASQALTFTTTSLTVYKAGTAAAWASGGTLSVRGVCTFLKVGTDTWYVSGATLS